MARPRAASAAPAASYCAARIPLAARYAAEIARRSGVLVELSDDERRIFDAVVRKEQLPLNGSRDGEIQRLRKEVGRSEGMLTNENFVANAPPEVVEGEREKLARYRRELDALDG